jgi:hypothetical protein
MLIGGAVLGTAAGAVADDTQTIEALKAQVDALQQMAEKAGLIATPTPKVVKAMSDITLSGFVTASYFYDTSSPPGNNSGAYLWNAKSDQFTLNKVKLTLASAPVEYSGEKWDSAFRVSWIWGSDAQYVNTGGEQQGFEDLREAYIEMNAPVGTGLNIKVGQLISLLNYESGDGGAVNGNFSQGNQWWYTGNGPGAGVQLGYNATEKVNLKFRVQNGMYSGPFDNNDAKTLMGSIGITPTDKLWLTAIGFGGNESSTLSIVGGSLLGGYKFTKQFGTGVEFDYFSFDPSGQDTDTVWSIGNWIWYDFTEKFGVALRSEYLNDGTGYAFGNFGLNMPAQSPNGPDDGGAIYGFTLTLNIKPVENVKIQPEVRYDATTVKGGFNGDKSCRVIVGAGISYLF